MPLWLQLNKVSKKYMDALSARLRHLGITRYFFLLVAIGEGKGSLTQQDLADLWEVDKVSMVGILDYLADTGFVERKPSRSDRRKHMIILTPKAVQALPEIKKVIRELNRRALSRLPERLATSFPEALALMKGELEKAIRETAPTPPPARARRKKLSLA